MDFIQQDAPGLPDDFRQAAAPAERRERVTLEIDADVMEFLRAEGSDWRRQVNELLRFFKDTSHDHEPGPFEPGELAPPPPAFA